MLIFSVWGLVSIILVWLQIVLYHCSKKHPNAKHCFDRITRTVTEPIIETVFSAMLKNSTNEDGEKVYTIFNYKVPKVYKLHLFAIVLNLIGVASMQFLEDFVFEESHICSTDPQLACFRSFPNMSTPRMDCSNTSYLEDNNITSVICYRYVFRVGIATGSALGLVTTTALIFYPINLIIIMVSQIMRTKGNVCCCICATILPIQLIVVAVIITATVLLCYNQYQTCSTKEQQETLIMKNICIGYTLAYCTMAFPWYLFKKKDENKNSYEQL